MTNQQRIEEAMSKFGEIAREVVCAEVIDRFKRLGEECVKKIRLRSKEESWIDHTGNLRSSIGMAVYKEGQVQVQSAFDQVKAPDGDGGEGQSKGRQMVNNLSSLYANTCALVVVAGMEYASEVEALANKDVLESTKHWAIGVVNVELQKAVDIAIEKMNRGIFDLD